MFSIDEVFLDIEYDKRYVVIIRDYITSDIIEVLPNRNYETINNFFKSYSYEERLNVKYIISDMYAPYLNLSKKYLCNASAIIDSFHVIQIIEKALRKYIDEVKKRYQRIQDTERRKKNYETNSNHKTKKDFIELTLLKKHSWVLLCKPGNEPDISSKHFSRKLGIYPTVEKIQKMFLALDPMFEPLKALKYEYLSFNDEFISKPDETVKALKELIDEYNTSEYKIYKEFSSLLKKHFNQIIKSFTVVKVENKNYESFYQRLSNGPQEGFNRKPKDMKRMARGFTNFDFVRNRILWSSRKDAAILAVPKSYKEIANHTSEKRGPYKKNT